VSSNIDDQTLHELYLWYGAPTELNLLSEINSYRPFQDAVHAGSGNIMCSYNRVNNSYGCANSKLLNGILKTELGFEGFVVTDWGAQHAGVATALAGLDMMMPGPDRFWGSNLETAVKNGSVPEARLTDMATRYGVHLTQLLTARFADNIRIISTWYQFGQDKGFPKPGIGMPIDLTKAHQIVDARNISSRSTLFDGALEGHVLVKNIRNALPLSKPKMLSIFGYSAKNPDINTPTGGLAPWNFGTQSFNHSEFMGGFFGTADSEGSTPIAKYGTLYSGGGSGATSQGTVVSPFDAIMQRAYDDGTALFWDFTNGEPPVVPVSDSCFVFGNAYATEGADRRGARDDYTDGLIKHVAGRCNNTIVVLHNAGIRLVDQWIDHPNVTALIFAHLPGEASGRALVSLLYGDSYPSGKLPYTVAKNETDYPVLGPDKPDGKFLKFPQSNFTEGVMVDYRHFDAKNITPRYEFGFGLSYTTFEYGNLAVQKDGDQSKFSEFPTGDVRMGGQVDLWDVLASVTAEVKNTGQRDGAEVTQLYVGIPVAGQPLRQLRGFEKVVINATASATVKFELTRRDLSVWDVLAGRWRLVKGQYSIEVGGSSRNLPLRRTLVI